MLVIYVALLLLILVIHRCVSKDETCTVSENADAQEIQDVESVEHFIIKKPEVSKQIEELNNLVIKMHTYSLKYPGVDTDAVYDVIDCESSWNPNAHNSEDSHASSKGSHGLAQFSRDTIRHYGKEIGINNADPYNPDHALQVMLYMWSKGQARQWSCARHLGYAR